MKNNKLKKKHVMIINLTSFKEKVILHHYHQLLKHLVLISFVRIARQINLIKGFNNNSKRLY